MRWYRHTPNTNQQGVQVYTVTECGHIPGEGTCTHHQGEQSHIIRGNRRTVRGYVHTPSEGAGTHHRGVQAIKRFVLVHKLNNGHLCPITPAMIHERCHPGKVPARKHQQPGGDVSHFRKCGSWLVDGPADPRSRPTLGTVRGCGYTLRTGTRTDSSNTGRCEQTMTTERECILRSIGLGLEGTESRHCFPEGHVAGFLRRRQN